MNKRNLRLLAHNAHDQATLTATSEALPIANTQRSERPMVWRSTDLSEQVIEAQLATGAVIDCVALVRHNLGASGLRRIELLYQGDVVYDSGPEPTAILIPAGVWRAGVDAWGATYNDQLPVDSAVTVHWVPQQLLVTGYRITLTSANPDGFMQIGRIFAGASFSPEVNFDWSPKVEWQEQGEHLPTEGGSLRTVGLSGLRRKVDLQLSWLSDSDRVQLVSLLGKAGLSADLLISLYPSHESEMLELEGLIVCRRAPAISTQHTRPDNWQMPQTFIEV
ncbi:hypothetical protein ABMA58_00210 [Oceanospirillum sp. HFRX-1_2]